MGAEPSIADRFDQACRDHDAGRGDARDAALAALVAAAGSPADGLRLIGALALRSGRADVAIAHAGAGAAPAAALRDLGRALELTGARDAAALSYQAALARAPDDAETALLLADTLLALDRLEPAIARYRAALAHRPDLALAHANLAAALAQRGEVEAAEASYRAALRLAPELAGAHEGLGQILLLDGRFPDGWAEHEWRRHGPNAPRRFAVPQWAGEPLDGRRLLIHAEQGFGDTIQFCRYVPRIAPPAQLVLLVPPPLLRLMASLAGGARLVTDGDPLPDVDLHCPMLSLPRAFGTTLASVPADVPYLAAEPARAAAWRARLAALPGRRVGLAWAGRPSYRADRRRSLDVADLAPLAAAAGVSWVSLQTGPAAARLERAPPGLAVHDWSAGLADFAETAALIDGLDLVIAADTAVAHLAGALGKPVWLLNRFDGCWRWLRGRADSPWYPTLRQFRQPRAGDWAAVLRAVAAALADQRVMR